jgi:hypothetical protein
MVEVFLVPAIPLLVEIVTVHTETKRGNDLRPSIEIWIKVGIQLTPVTTTRSIPHREGVFVSEKTLKQIGSR